MKKVAYFDNAATTYPKPESVYDFTDRFYRKCGVNVGRGQHKLASKASALVQETRELILELFHCPAKKVVFTHTATEAINFVLRGLPVNNKYTIYISPFEHMLLPVFFIICSRCMIFRLKLSVLTRRQ